MFDGGCREPTVMWWPGKIPGGHGLPDAGHDHRHPADDRRTWSGAKLPEHTIDGKNIWPLIAGEPGAKSPHEAYYFYWGEAACRRCAWAAGSCTSRTPTGRSAAGPAAQGGKPVPLRAGEDRAWPCSTWRRTPARRPTSPEQHPDVVAKIKALADRMRADLGDSATGQKGAGVREPGRLRSGDLRFDWDPEKPIVVEPRRQP